MMTQLMVLWIAMGVVTLGLALYRKILSMREDPYVHISAGEQRYIPQQVETYNRLSAIDRWGISLTILTTLLGLGLGVAYVIQTAPLFQ